MRLNLPKRHVRLSSFLIKSGEHLVRKNSFLLCQACTPVGFGRFFSGEKYSCNFNCIFVKKIRPCFSLKGVMALPCRGRVLVGFLCGTLKKEKGPRTGPLQTAKNKILNYFFPYFFWNFSTRPAVSTNSFLPVKNGCEAELTSTLITG